MNRNVRTYLNTLRRLPDDVILSTATRDIDVNVTFRCVCGWTAREIQAREQNCDAGEAFNGSLVKTLMRTAGGRFAEWQRVNHAFCDQQTAVALEEAFTRRVMEAAGVA
jgi:hypothetical protein